MAIELQQQASNEKSIGIDRVSGVRTGVYALGILAVLALLLTGGCATQDGPPKTVRDVSTIPDAQPTVHDGRFKNSEYTLGGVTYTPLQEIRGYQEEGVASWYGTKFHGKQTANGEVYDLYGMTAAHKTLPLPSYVKVTNKENGRSVVLRVNDRGPFHGDRLIDLSYAAAVKLDFARFGTADVLVEGIDVEAFIAAQNRREAGDAEELLFVQLAALKSHHNAQLLRRQIASLIDGEVHVVKGGEENSPLYRVRVGPVESVELLEGLLEQLNDKDLGLPYLVYE